MKIAEVMPPEPSPLWALVRQCGVEHVVGGFPKVTSGDGIDGAEKPWHLGPLRKAHAAYRKGGFELAVIEARPPMEKIKRGLPGRDDEIDEVCALIRAMRKSPDSRQGTLEASALL